MLLDIQLKPTIHPVRHPVDIFWRLQTYQCTGFLDRFVGHDYGHTDNSDGHHKKTQAKKEKELHFSEFEYEQTITIRTDPF